MKEGLRGNKYERGIEGGSMKEGLRGRKYERGIEREEVCKRD